MRAVNVVFDRAAEAPFNGSPAIINAYLRDSLLDLGLSVHSVYGPLSAPGDDIPLRLVDRVVRLRSLPLADLQLWCDMGLGLAPVQRRSLQKNVVFFHGLAGFPGHWIGNEAIDRYWCNSPYAARVLRSILSIPDWGLRRALDPRAFWAVSSITLALPCLEEPEGLPTDGATSFSRQARAALDSGDLLGYCVAEKCNERALYSILLLLNQISLESGDGRKFKVFTDHYTFNVVKGLLHTYYPEDLPPEFLLLKGALEQLGLEVEDILVPVPRLAQPVMFELLKACRFGLAYNRVPESFGLLPLESVFHGCPVYTNGAGNIRNLLPEGCGINVCETEQMAFGDPSAYQEVAREIFRDVVEEPERARAACRRGVDFMRTTYTRESMRRDVEGRLSDLAAPVPADGLDFESLEITLSPLVRSWNGATRCVLSDYRSEELSPDESELIGDLLGERCHAVTASGKTLERIERLFKSGILALAPPIAESRHAS